MASRNRNKDAAPVDEVPAEPDPANDVPSTGITPEEQGFAVGPKESTPAVHEVRDETVVGGVTYPEHVPGLSTFGFDGVHVDGKVFDRPTLEAALAHQDEVRDSTTE